MALIIKADKRPKNCGECIGWYKCEGWKEPYTCPIIGEIPDEHGDLIDRGELQDVLRIVSGLVINNKLTDNEIAVVLRTIGAISEAINEANVIVGATEEHATNEQA